MSMSKIRCYDFDLISICPSEHKNGSFPEMGFQCGLQKRPNVDVDDDDDDVTLHLLRFALIRFFPKKSQNFRIQTHVHKCRQRQRQAITYKCAARMEGSKLIQLTPLSATSPAVSMW